MGKLVAALVAGIIGLIAIIFVVYPFAEIAQSPNTTDQETKMLEFLVWAILIVLAIVIGWTRKS